MFGRGRREVAELAVRQREARARATLSRARLERAKADFLGHPATLLLPFTAGLLGGALASHRRPAASGEKARDAIAWGSLAKTATTLWGLSLPLREAILDVHAARMTEAATDTASPAAPTSESSDVGLRPPTRSPGPASRPAPGSADRPARRPPPQPAPPA